MVPLDETPTKLLLVVLAASQGAVLVAGLWGRAPRLGCGVAFLCPAVILGICLSRMGPGIEWSHVNRLEAGFLALNLASALVSLFLIPTSGRPLALLWSVWIANSVSCAFMIYLAFFFRLF